MLGESYIKCGRHTAGLKALEHVLELDPANWMALYHMADIHSQLGEFDKAIEAYEHILTITGDDQVGVTAALASAELAQGQQAAAGGFRERSRRAFHAALGLARKVLLAGGHRPWAWKVVGDAAFELASYEARVEDAQESSEALRPILEHLVNDDSDRRSTVEGLGHAANMLQSSVDLSHTAKSAIFAYAYRAHLLKNEPRVIDSALYDLATSLHAFAIKSEGAEKIAGTKAAISAIRFALERDAGDERLWNALGVLCEGAGAQLAQHAFVVSLELYQKVRTIPIFGKELIVRTRSYGLTLDTYTSNLMIVNWRINVSLKRKLWIRIMRPLGLVRLCWPIGTGIRNMLGDCSFIPLPFLAVHW